MHDAFAEQTGSASTETKFASVIAPHPPSNAAGIREGDEQPVGPQARLLRLLGQARDCQVVQHSRRYQGRRPKLRQVCMRKIMLLSSMIRGTSFRAAKLHASR